MTTIEEKMFVYRENVDTSQEPSLVCKILIDL